MIALLLSGTVVAIGILAFLAVGARISGLRRALIVCMLPIALCLASVSAYSVATGPLPHWMEYRVGETELVSRRFDEGRAIYLWVLWPEEILPRAYALPWSEETAEAIETAEGEQEREGGQVVVEFESGGDDEQAEGDNVGERLGEMLSLEDRPPPVVHARPHPRAPAKEPPRRPMVDLPSNGWSPFGRRGE